MRKNLQAILFLKAFTLGTLAPVFVLVLTSHGATVQTSSLFKGIGAFVIIAAEFPSGVFADLFGRKRSFIVSLILQLSAVSLLLLSSAPAALAAVMVLYGLSRAFASGSIEALAIDEAASDSRLTRVASRLNILESAGLAAGALAGGGLAGFGTRYEANIITNIAGAAVLLLLTVCTVRESRHRQHSAPCLKEHLRKSFSFVFGSRVVKILFALCFLTGFAMVTVETYWQPAFKAFSSAKWMFGVVSCVGFAGVIAGSKVSEFILTRRPRSGMAVFLVSKALMSGFLALLTAAGTQTPFVLVYIFWYVFLGGNGVAEQTLLNREAPAAQRASILSLFSFDMQIGALFSSLFCYLVSTHMDYRYTWLFAACILAAATAVFTVRTLRRRARGPA